MTTQATIDDDLAVLRDWARKLHDWVWHSGRLTDPVPPHCLRLGDPTPDALTRLEMTAPGTLAAIEYLLTAARKAQTAYRGGQDDADLWQAYIEAMWVVRNGLLTIAAEIGRASDGG